MGRLHVDEFENRYRQQPPLRNGQPPSAEAWSMCMKCGRIQRMLNKRLPLWQRRCICGCHEWETIDAEQKAAIEEMK